MAFYWSARSMPELRALPSGIRNRIVDRAIRTFPVTFWSGLFVTGFMVGGGTIGALVAITLGWLPGSIVGVGLSLLAKPLVLNLARRRILELLGSGDHEARP